MFTLTVSDETVYQRFMDRVAVHGGSVDDVLREWLDQAPDLNGVSDQEDDEEGKTRAEKLLRLIDEANFQFPHLFDARDAEDFMNQELKDESRQPVTDQNVSE